jgi:hypothetical protein
VPVNYNHQSISDLVCVGHGCQYWGGDGLCFLANREFRLQEYKKQYPFYPLPSDPPLLDFCPEDTDITEPDCVPEEIIILAPRVPVEQKE